MIYKISLQLCHWAFLRLFTYNVKLRYNILFLGELRHMRVHKGGSYPLAPLGIGI